MDFVYAVRTEDDSSYTISDVDVCPAFNVMYSFVWVFLFQNDKAQINYHKYSFLNRNNLSEKKCVLQHMLDMLGNMFENFILVESH